jgi:hypothetical protein
VEVVVLAGAESDLWSAWVRYEELANGLGEKFEKAVRIGLIHLGQFPRSAPIYIGDFRRLLLRRFDHGIFYRMHGSRVVVVAILGLRQSPASIRQRLGASES